MILLDVFGPLAHLLVAYLALVHPWLGRRSYRRLRAQLPARPNLRRNYYLRMIGQEWLWLLVAVLALPRGVDLRWTLGLIPPYRFGWVILLAVAIASIIALLGLRLSTRLRLRTQAQLRRADALMPHTSGERLLFLAVALSAGFCEEVVFRGFLGYYFSYLFFDQEIWLTLAPACLIFGLVHVYQGKLAVVATTLLGVLFFLLFWLSGSLWPAILLHVVFDVRPLFVLPPERPAALEGA